MRALIDGDIILHRVGFTTQEEESHIAVWRCNEMLKNILIHTGADEYEVWLSDTTANNFRTLLYPEYKANRTAPKPRHYELLKEYMVKEWEARIAHNQEADDALGIGQDKVNKQTIICSIDKDLKQVPGLHYNFVKDEFDDINEAEGYRNFYKQVLTGDSTDNIKGCPKIGPVKAEQALVGKGTAAEMYQRVVELYLSQFAIHRPEVTEDEVIEYLVMTCRILRIKHEEQEELWLPPLIPDEYTQQKSKRKDFPAMDPRSDPSNIPELEVG